ncbi:hypothetical protein [Streptomyces sp. NPDC059788]|uniref:hypothetical protein n=1 Tax=Streptomyces sp. NPDC059788 TaxID=3346948 RepID=UPI003652818B
MDDLQPSTQERPCDPVRRYATGLRKISGSRPKRYVIIGNHLAQHRELSAMAIGIATYILSLPDGSPVDIVTLAKRFPEGRERIAAALRQLEDRGYIERARQRGDRGRFRTVTYAYANPETPDEPPDNTPTTPTTTPATNLPPQPQAPPPIPKPRTTPPPPAAPPPAPASRPRAPGTPALLAPTPLDLAELTYRGFVQAPPRPAPEPPPATPAQPSPKPSAAALDVLSGLRADDPRLLLSQRDVHRLAPSVARWLERGVSPESVRRALTADLPPRVKIPAAFVAHRLDDLLPPPLPEPPAQPHVLPLRNCPECDLAFRSAHADLCNPCLRRTGAPA